MSAESIWMMVIVLVVVWGGFGLTLWLAWRQEHRSRHPEDESVVEGKDDRPPPSKPT